MKKQKVISIDIDEKTKKDFKVVELTVNEIISLSQINPLFSGDAQGTAETAEKPMKNPTAGDEHGLADTLIGDLIDFSGAVKKVMEISCDFELDDIKELAPSDVGLIYDGFKEVNETFLNLLERVGILRAVEDIVKAAISDFSRTLAI